MGEVERLVIELTRGLEVHVRHDERVIRVHGGGATVGEVVAGDSTVRLNLKKVSQLVGDLAHASGIELSGRSRIWDGGTKVTPQNIAAVRQILETSVQEFEVESMRHETVNEMVDLLLTAAKQGHLTPRAANKLDTIHDLVKAA